MNEIFGGERGQKIAKAVLAAVILLAAFLAVQVLVGLKKMNYIGKEIYPQRTIMVAGEGEAFAIPDVASFSFTVTEASESVDSAQDMLDVKIKKGVDLLKADGVEEKDIKTTSYNVYPKYEWNQKPCALPAVNSSSVAPSYYPCPTGKNELVGYEVSQTITVKVREIKKAGDLVSKIGAVGVSNISGVEFTVDDREEYVAKAREEAIKKAKEKAEKLADDLGVRLGKMLYFNENGGYPYYAEGMGGGMDMMKSASVAPRAASLPQGETKITSQVNITYEIR